MRYHKFMPLYLLVTIMECNFKFFKLLAACLDVPNLMSMTFIPAVAREHRIAALSDT